MNPSSTEIKVGDMVFFKECLGLVGRGVVKHIAYGFIFKKYIIRDDRYTVIDSFVTRNFWQLTKIS